MEQEKKAFKTRKTIWESFLDLGKIETWVQQALAHAFDSKISRDYMRRVREDTVMDAFKTISGVC
jgi:hypothetical protein